MFIGIMLNHGNYAYINVNLITCVLAAIEGNGCTVQTTDGKGYFTEVEPLEMVKKIEELIQRSK